ncbi:helix-turn-helix domain-containing protein [Bradyrhizobium sp. CCGB12]|uniref:IclR family transcriptional regulator n=1 Tax=Bradyrhizobium sp. CCGB12 TaxID=2949632 RepID=UPI0020B29B24|nr:helix-turn-helix domain-containing protein [Bradyrhizobium sp. CCGB12]MCP3395243.1 helix-turn-helix domain-containing protein [Bradyrhizobium sp. CCGB12]
MPPSRSGKSLGISVKSSLRTLQILEYIDSKQRAVTIAELSDNLDFPQSSTSTLVQSMINAGYLVVDHDGRSILPSSRVSALGNWVEPTVSRADIKSLMIAVGERTNQTILLGVPSDLCVRYIDVIPGRHAMRLDIPVGSRLPLMEAGMGRLLLSEMSDETVEELWQQTRRRIKEEGAQGIRPSDVSNLWNANPFVSPFSEIMEELQQIRRTGFSVSLGRISFGAGIVCVALPRGPLEQPIGLGIGGLSELISRDADQILKIVHEAACELGIPLKPGRESARTAERKTRRAQN